MSRIIIKNLSVNFRAYQNRNPSLKEYFANLFISNDKNFSNFQAIRNLSLTINSGDRVGLIGHNGAGKSTLLKALCRIYEDYDGKIIINGSVAPLLEIGAGFHPEFTGRENIYLNGTILGYSKNKLKEIEQDIISFAELENFIDTPVKYYSTGMYMRLAFSLATSIQANILILDEIFAGGDVDFLQKARNRLTNLINNANIIIMVSHDNELIKEFCNRVIWIDKGILIDDGKPEEVISKYLIKNEALL